ncbi:ferrous iron transport protein B [Candidatus Heimdallarchaeota archaeon]|nr:MAG: ferrous iron transport protein B [Candidatus Gerdarchaeota archaeon]RLI71658.1 MAG: ferrous iron transport protein B [Candidatus Gerdarchaeota archaeon]RLI73054.1 MAG: ferrous iron transport protein B [Candidatus Heimdallarchaeota archaeon]
MAKIALAGNPNVGKSVIFNALTGLNQRIANFPGCTVEKKEGKMHFKGREIEVTDLPGIYSLSPHSIDEEVSRKYIIEENPDLVVVVLDASNLERNLYLTVQLMELGVNLLAVLNMVDLARGKGIIIDSKKLSENLGIPVIETIAIKEVGITKLKNAICENLDHPVKPKPIIWKGNIEAALQVILNEIAPYSSRIEKRYPLNWLAISLLENDKYAWEIAIDSGIPENELKEKIETVNRENFKGDAVIAIVDARYDLIKDFIKDVVTDFRGRQWALSDMLDEVLTNRFLGIPIFLAIMWGVFQLTFTVGKPLVDLIGLGIAKLGDLIYYLANLLDGAGTGVNPITDFIVGALLNGFGTVISFVPYLIILFIALAILEDTGYLSRVAFIMDRYMSKVGLEGQAIIPMLLGFGCNVPGIMATRAIKNPQSRKTAILVNSFMSCSARLPVFILLAGSIFPAYAGLVTLSLYILGVIIGISFAWLFRKTLFRGGDTYLIIELQPYTRPSIKGVAIKMWNQTKEFFKKASSIILIAVITIYLLDASGILEYLGRGVAYLFWWMKTSDGTPLSWEYGAALLSGFVAKEVIIGTLSTLLNFDPSAPLTSNPLVNLGPAAGFGLLVFILLYVPCVATLAVIKKETGSTKWMFFSLAFTMTVAYTFSAIAYFLVRFIVSI